MTTSRTGLIVSIAALFAACSSSEPSEEGNQQGGVLPPPAPPPSVTPTGGSTSTPPVTSTPPPVGGAQSVGDPVGGGSAPPPAAGAGGAPLAGSGAAGAMGAAGATTPPPPAGPSCLDGSGDYVAKGPYGVGMMDVQSVGSSGPFTIFYPMPFDSDCKHPIVAWGNGTGVTGSGTYGFYQDHAASWGIVVIASHNSNTGSGQFHKDGLDYLLAQNEDPSSMFFGKLSPRAGTSGHSQGGMGANQGASHPNVEAEVNVQGAFGTAPRGVAFLCLTGTEDIATEGCKTAVNSSDSPALYANYEGATHTGTATLGGFFSGDPGTVQYVRFYSAWFRCFLADDQGACALFKGGDACPVCSDPGWAEIFAKNY